MTIRSTTVKVDNIFQTLVASKKLDLSKIKIVANNFEKTFESNVLTTVNTETLLDKNSINYLNITLTEMLSYVLKPYCKNFVFNVEGIWVNKYEDNDYQGMHIHPSDFSFIIYYKGNSNTVFNSPMKNILEIYGSEIFDRAFEPKLVEGDIFLFPSYLEHWVRPNSGNITISGNIKIVELIKEKNE